MHRKHRQIQRLARPARRHHARAVDLSNYLRMDPHLLVGLINTELRNHCDSLDDLAKKHGLDQGKLEAALSEADYAYRPEQNQFR